MKTNGLINMTEGTPWKLILVFSLPMLLGNFLQQMYNVIDSVIAGQYIGPTALAAVGTAFPVIFLMISMFIGFGVGATIIISQYYGAGNREAVQKTIDTIYVTLFAFAIPLTLIGIFIARPLLVLMNTPSDVLDQATIFMQITFIGTIGMFGYNVNAGILQGLGDSKTPLIYLGMSTGMNIGLVILFVAGFHWGLPGLPQRRLFPRCSPLFLASGTSTASRITFAFHFADSSLTKLFSRLRQTGPASRFAERNLFAGHHGAPESDQ